MSTPAITTATTSENPFDAPLPSEVDEHQQASAAKVAAGGNPFDTPLPSEKAEAHTQDTGQVTNDVGNTVIVPKDGESFEDTMKRAAAYGKTVTPQQINAEVSTMPGKAATVLAAAPVMGAAGAASLAVPGEVVDFALKHLAGNVLPGMEYEAAKQTLSQAVPKITQFIQTMSKLGIGAGGITYAIKSLMGDGKK